MGNNLFSADRPDCVVSPLITFYLGGIFPYVSHRRNVSIGCAVQDPHRASSALADRFSVRAEGTISMECMETISGGSFFSKSKRQALSV